MGVCVQCGERFILPEVAKNVDAALEAKARPIRVLQVPVYQYQLDVA